MGHILSLIHSYESRVLGEFCNLLELHGQHAKSGLPPVLPLVVPLRLVGRLELLQLGGCLTVPIGLVEIAVDLFGIIHHIVELLSCLPSVDAVREDFQVESGQLGEDQADDLYVLSARQAEQRE